jgi:hypothetical protein
LAATGGGTAIFADVLINVGINILRSAVELQARAPAALT